MFVVLTVKVNMQFNFKEDLVVDFKLKDCGIVWITKGESCDGAISRMAPLAGVWCFALGLTHSSLHLYYF